MLQLIPHARQAYERAADLESLVRRKMKGITNINLFIHRFKLKAFDAVEEASLHHGMFEIIDH